MSILSIIMAVVIGLMAAAAIIINIDAGDPEYDSRIEKEHKEYLRLLVEDEKARGLRS